jgi:hypothetical protein
MKCFIFSHSVFMCFYVILTINVNYFLKQQLTCMAFLAAKQPMETWSSVPALVLSESTDAGWHKALFSDTVNDCIVCTNTAVSEMNWSHISELIHIKKRKNFAWRGKVKPLCFQQTNLLVNGCCYSVTVYEICFGDFWINLHTYEHFYWFGHIKQRMGIEYLWKCDYVLRTVFAFKMYGVWKHDFLLNFTRRW